MEKILIVYWLQTGNTEAMAHAIVKGIQQAGGDVVVEQVDTRPDITAYDKIAFGCPAMGAEVLEECEFEPYFMSIEPSLANKKVALFGSYGWGSGEWMDVWSERVKANQANVYHSLIINYTPDDAGVQECEEFGAEFTKF